MDELFELDKSLIFTRDYNMSPGRPVAIATAAVAAAAAAAAVGTPAHVDLISGKRRQLREDFCLSSRRCKVQLRSLARANPISSRVTEYEALWAVVRKGDFRHGGGWGGSGIGNFWGGMTIQGLVVRGDLTRFSVSP
jgi:hypothetical protein